MLENAQKLIADSGLDMHTVLMFAIILGVAAIIVMCVLRVVRVAAGLIAFALVVPILFTVYFGNGRGFVEKGTRFLPEETRQTILQGYDYFKAAEQEDPMLNVPEIESHYDALLDKAREKLVQAVETTEETDETAPAEQGNE